jgi:nucleoside-diphosphate-sugar epimerase
MSPTEATGGPLCTSSMPPASTGSPWKKGSAGDWYHAIAEEGVPLKDIATAIGRGLNVPVVRKTPEEAKEHFGWLGSFADMDLWASSAQTREKLGWNPTGPKLIADLENMRYSKK